MNNQNRLRLTKLAFCVAIAVGAVPALAQNTTSAVGGRITATDGKSVAGAAVRIVHVESGSVTNATTDAEGRYQARGLRVGGPYTITITKDGVTEKRENVFLILAETTTIDAKLGAKAATEKIEVTASAISDAFSKSAMGAGTNVGRDQLDTFGSINRNLQDYARIDPRLSQTDKERGEISAGGQNSRFNSITIDGVSISDTFGLEANNLPTRNQPISIDAIQSVQVNISNYDVTQKGYTGANINAVTKSGTNDLKGSIYRVYRDQKLIGDLYNRATDSYTDFANFEEKRTGITLGGPIIKDKLFFFISAENSDTNLGVSVPEFSPIGGPFRNVGITQSAISGAQNIAQSRYGINIGTTDVPAGVKVTTKDLTAKLDWNISDRHRANVRYNETKQVEPRFFGFGTTSIPLNSYLTTEAKKIESVVAQVFSDWTDSFSTEAKVSKRQTSAAFNNNSRLPSIALQFGGALPPDAPVGTATGNRTLFAGTELSRQFNVLNTTTYDAYLGGTLFLKNHELKFGGDFSENQVYNAFLQNVNGTYTFSCVNSSATYAYSFGAINCGTATAAQVEAAVLENFRIGRPSIYTAQVPVAGGSLNDGIAVWKLQNLGGFIQDTWTVNKNLTLMLGVRIDVPKMPVRPRANAAAAAPVGPLVTVNGVQRASGGFGLDNTVTLDGQDLFQPRIGFNYTFDTKRPMQVRGGFGLFQGAAANVWLSNPYSNTGVSTRIITCNGTAAVGGCPQTGGLFSANPDAQPVNVTGSPPSANVDFLQNGLGQPSVWKANLAFEHQLPWWGLVASAEYIYTKTNTGLYYQHLNLGDPTRIGPDGRQIFWDAVGLDPTRFSAVGINTAGRTRALNNPSFNNVLLAAETKKGGGNQLTVGVNRPTSKGWGWSLAYTYTQSKEVNPLTSSVSNSNWLNRAVFNPNEDVASNSNYLIKDRFNGTLNWERAFFGKYKTRVGMFYEGRRGKPYSWTFIGDMNGDNVGGNDLMYIPRGPGSGEVVFAGATPAEQAANEQRFWQIVNDNGIKTRGGVVGRNDTFNPWVNSLDMRISQELPGFVKEHKAMFVLDILNFTNLLNKKWGRTNEIGFPSTRSFARFGGIDAQGRYVYVLNGQTLGDFTTRQARGESQWGMQATFRYEF
jgi:Carboxypeptidase regulatory-like domain